MIIKLERVYKGKAINKILGIPPKFQILNGRKIFATLEEATNYIDKTSITQEEKAEAKKIFNADKALKIKRAEDKIKLDKFNKKCTIPFKMRVHGYVERSADFKGVYQRGKIAGKYPLHFLFEMSDKKMAIFKDVTNFNMFNIDAVVTKIARTKDTYKYKNINYYFIESNTDKLHDLLKTYTQRNIRYEFENVDY